LLEEEGALVVVTCALCDAPSKFAQKVHPVLADGTIVSATIIIIIIIIKESYCATISMQV